MSGHEMAPSSALPAWNLSARLLSRDDYVWKARKVPVFLTALPMFLAAGAWFPALNWWVTLPAGAGCLLLGLCGHLGRIRGKAGEEILFARWGGTPTTKLLRHGESPFAAQKLALLHTKLAELTGIEAPSPREERKRPDEADKIYEGYVSHLRNATRRREEFPLVREELINYGFARNVWGLRPFGIGSSVLGLGAALARLGWLWQSGAASGYEAALVIAGFNLLLLGFWLFWAREAWVKQVAEVYAQRLLDAAATLPAKEDTS